MSTQASEDPPRVVRTARILGYVSAALFAIDIAWVLLAHMGTTVSDAQYSVGMMLLSALSVVAAIFAFLVQSDYRRGRREDRRHAEIVARQDQRHAEIMAALQSTDASGLAALAARLEQSDYGQREGTTTLTARVMELSEKLDRNLDALRAAFDPAAIHAAIEKAVRREVDVFLLDLAEGRPDVVDLETVKILRRVQQRHTGPN